ncbi:MAG: pilus assembly protein [Holosporaceae bacterium]|jgi:Flp pilus assembly protein TadG|nr:pilus assembly protein [Holosporaceae bacterium]
MKLFTRKYRGSVAVEAALTFPIVCYLIFFILEIMKINDTQIAADSIATEMAFAFMASRNTDNFDEIVNQYKPPYISENKITWYFYVYEDLLTMNSEDSNDNKDLSTADSEKSNDNNKIYWPSSENTIQSENGNIIKLVSYKTPETSFSLDNSDTKFQTLSGKAFVLTVVCDYQFSNDLVKRIFIGAKGSRGEGKYIIHGRGVGVCS